MGDTLFMPDSGSARADFPGGDAGQLYDSIHRVWPCRPRHGCLLCHDYGAGGTRPVAWETTVAAERAENIHIAGGITREAFNALRQARECHACHAAADHPVSAGEHARGATSPRQVGRPMLKVPVNAL